MSKSAYSPKVVAPIRRVATLSKLACVACRGTGVEHRVVLPHCTREPTGNACPSCDGNGVQALSPSNEVMP
jgi:DnaJ-class molecular chaperone